MKNIVIFLGVLLITVAGGNCQMEDLPDDMKIVVENCLKKFDASNEEHLVAMKNNDYETYPKLRCMRDCVMTESDMMKDGEIKIEKMKEVMATYNPAVTEEEIKNTHAKCLAQAQQKTDKCDFANEYGKCADAVFMKM